MKKVFLFLAVMGLLVACQQNPNQESNNDKTEDVQASMLSSSSKSANVSTAQDGEVWLESLITDTPQEGRELAIKMARKTIGAIQSDPEVKKKLRATYSENAQELILSAQVVAAEFQTVAEANNYWRK